jgi:hypothetical protein
MARTNLSVSLNPELYEIYKSNVIKFYIHVKHLLLSIILKKNKFLYFILSNINYNK